MFTKESYKDATGMIQGCYKDDTMMIQG